MSDPPQRRVPFTAPLIANVMAPVAEAAGRAARAALPFADLEDVPCPLCGRVIALWVPSSGCLYRTGRDATLGAPLSADRRERVEVRCDACRKNFPTSGRKVGQHLHNGRPPLTA